MTEELEYALQKVATMAPQDNLPGKSFFALMNEEIKRGFGIQKCSSCGTDDAIGAGFRGDMCFSCKRQHEEEDGPWENENCEDDNDC